MPVQGLNDYTRSVLRTRTTALRRAETTVAIMLDALGDAATDIMATLEITDKVSLEPIRRQLLVGKLARIQDRMVALGAEYNDIVRGAASATIDDVVTVRRAATARLATANGAAFVPSFTAVPELALRMFARRLDVEGLKISGRLWAGEQMQTIQRIIGQGLARGERAGRVAQRLEAFLRPDQRGGATRAIHLGDVPVSHKATRLAITEVNNTYWETSAISADQSTVVEAQQWNLSGRHPRTDVCDLFAWSDSYGLGSGVYPTGNMPVKPHPHCLCYVTDLIRDAAEWGRPKRDYPAPTLTRIDGRSMADAPPTVRQRLGQSFTPEELRQAVEGLPPAKRAHLTPRYVERMTDQFETFTRAGFTTPIGAAELEGAA